MVLAASMPLLAGAATAAELAGKVAVRDADGRPIELDSPAVVYFEPATPRRVSPLPKVAEMTTLRKEFTPHVLAVTRGSTVRFPNLDPILHNVFSVSSGNRFDLGLYRRGPGGSFTFDTSGTVRVFCNVHHSMVGYVLVLETAHYETVEVPGSFRLRNLPNEGGTLTVWHPRAQPWSARIAPGQRVDASLVVTRQRIPLHRDKNGRSYRARRNRYNR